MNPHDRRARLHREFRPEPLEDRSLLNATLPTLSAQVASVRHQPASAVVHGQFPGSIVQPPLLPSQSTTAAAISIRNGAVQFFSTFDIQRNAAFSPVLTIQGGTAAFVSPKFGVVNVAFTGNEIYSHSGLGTIQVNGVVTGVGGSAFAGDIGTFHAKATVELSTGIFDMQYTLNLHRV
jgi:hypothetical protein